MKKLNIRRYFLKIDGKKEILNILNIKIFGMAIFVLFAATEVFWPQDQTGLSKSNKQFVSNGNLGQEKQSSSQTSKRASEVISSHQEQFEAQQRGRHRKVRRIPLVPQNVIFNATQVITRSGIGGTMRPLPSGTNFIGQLLNGIDTRNQNQIIKVLLPYGARHRNGGTIPKNTTLLGAVSYSGQGEKVYIGFNRAIFPNGKEYKINAQALNSKDYSAGLVGEFHGNADLRIAAAIGLTMVSAAAGVLTTKATIGALDQSGQATIVPESTMRNALLHGVSKVSEQEATRQAQELEQKKQYVTVDAGSDLIVSLLITFNGEVY